MRRYICSLAFLTALCSSALAQADERYPRSNTCTFRFLCFDKSSNKTASLQQIITDRVSQHYKPGERRNFNYADLKIDCRSADIERFARQFVDRAWDAGLVSNDRELALTVDIEKITSGSSTSTALATYLIAQFKRDANSNLSVTGCDDFIATNISFNTKLRLKFKLLQSKHTTVSPATYSAFRLVANFIGFLAGGPGGAALTSKVGDISKKVQDNKSDIDAIVGMFDEINTQKPQVAFDVSEKSVTLTLADNSKFTLRRQGKRSAFLSFDDDKVQSPGANIQQAIADNTGLDLSRYLSTSAGGWDDLLASSAQDSATKGCRKVRTALDGVFTKEESIVVLARLIGNFGDAAIRSLKDPCLSNVERLALKAIDVPDPLGEITTENGGTPRDPARDNLDKMRWGAVEAFLTDFGTTLASMAQIPNGAPARAKKLMPYFDARVATQSFDLSELLPSIDGVLSETLAGKVAAWPAGKRLRFGCFLPPSKSMQTKYSAQMLVELDSGGSAPLLINMIIGFTDRDTTDVEKLVIGNMLIERPTAASLSGVQDRFKRGCGSRSDPWKPWEMAVARKEFPAPASGVVAGVVRKDMAADHGSHLPRHVHIRPAH